MKIVQYIQFEEDEILDFQRVASASILASTTDDDPNALTFVRRAVQGDVFSFEQIEDFGEALRGAIRRREENITNFYLAEHPDLAEAAAQWLPPLQVVLDHVIDARSSLLKAPQN